jgi:hypothetical protein
MPSKENALRPPLVFLRWRRPHLRRIFSEIGLSPVILLIIHMLQKLRELLFTSLELAFDQLLIRVEAG